MKNIIEDIKDQIDYWIDDKFNTVWYTEDFEDAYKKANGIEGEMTEEQWTKFEDKMGEPGFLERFRETCIEDINERISMLFFS